MVSKHKRIIEARIEVTPYIDTNEVINNIRDDDETIWVAQGNHGRVIIIANTKEEAGLRYVEKYARQPNMLE